MAQNNHPSSSNASSICLISNITHDNIHSILLLLPVSSVVSFSMTCRKFKWLVGCDYSLWESVCRRDWGDGFVDGVKGGGVEEWKRLYKEVVEMRCVNGVRLMGGGRDGGVEVPSPRASHSLNYVDDCLVLFGGGCDGGRHLDDTWVAYIGKEYRRILRWQKVTSGAPSGRFGQTCAVFGETLVLFGGINDHGIRQNDTWLGHITRSEMQGIRLSWRLLDVGPIAPPPRGAHAGCCVDDKNMVIHGGIGLNGQRLNDTWILDKISNGIGYSTWREIVTRVSPPARSGHTLTCVGGTRMVLFGGRGIGYEVLNDAWVLDARDQYPEWVQITYNSERIPLPRVGHSATFILGGRLLIYGGEDSYRHKKEDFWVLDVNMEKLSNKMMWKRLKANGHYPSCRSFHRACADCSGRYIYVFGGMVDSIVEPSEASGLKFDGNLFLVELVLQS